MSRVSEWLAHQPVLLASIAAAVAAFAAKHGFNLTADQALTAYTVVGLVVTGGTAQLKVVSRRALRDGTARLEADAIATLREVIASYEAHQ